MPFKHTVSSSSSTTLLSSTTVVAPADAATYESYAETALTRLHSWYYDTGRWTSYRPARWHPPRGHQPGDMIAPGSDAANSVGAHALPHPISPMLCCIC